MNELEVSDGKVVRIWWLLTWRFNAGAFVGWAVLAALLGFLTEFMNLSLGRVILDPQFVVWLGSALWSFFWFFIVIRMMLKKRYNGFRLAIIADEPATAEQPEASQGQP
ncbi:hypothetical protein [Thalassospira australica]|uniref:hypothetical protein n=1 Tax=Thalassospira australica TaxID=1528106 RepID=UPI00051A4672|nr:hypothetical protein [Thalassospira australica]